MMNGQKNVKFCID